MGKRLRECVNKLRQGKDVKDTLRDYLEQSMQLYSNYAAVKLMMEYYLYYEMLHDDGNVYADLTDGDIRELNTILRRLLDRQLDSVGRKETKETLLRIRRSVQEKMQVLAVYVDCFVIYEYILNRIQYRFEEGEPLPDDVPFTRDVLQFIFGSGDNVAINDNIRFVVGQLPVRMARSHYFDLVRQSISVYKGGDSASLDTFLYMFRTSAMLYHTEQMETCFTEFKPVIAELKAMDYGSMTEEEYVLCAQKIRDNAAKLGELSDLYMQLEVIVNDLYMLSVAGAYCEDDTMPTVAETVLRGLSNLFAGEDEGSWPDEVGRGSAEEKLLWLGEKLTEAEGSQERLYAQLSTAEAVFDETVQAYHTEVEQLGLSGQFGDLRDMARLNSGSVFVELGDVPVEKVVTEEELDREIAVLFGELKEQFQGSSRMLRRAVMANTLEKLPVFFQNRQEVADYISDSLAQCDDEAEKYAAKQLIFDMMQ